MKQPKNIIFTDADLDGAGSYLMFKWFTGKNIPYKVTTVTKFHDDYVNWCKKNNPDDYDNIYILDLDVSQNSLELVDRKNITIIDHHQSHYDRKNKYTTAKNYIQIYPSCCKLIYKMFKQQIDKKIDNNQRRLIALVDDYDSWTHKYTQSKQLNTVFWNYQGDRLGKFLNDFTYGFKGFSNIHLNVIQLHEHRYNKLVNGLQIHQANVNIQQSEVKCLSTFANSMISDVGDYLVNQKKADIAIITNLDTNRVSFRKNKQCTVDLSKLAKKIIDGGGHKDAAGGVVTDTFLEFSKLFQPCKT